MDAQRLFFSKLFTDGAIEDALDAQIQPQIFDEQYRNLFDFALEYFRRHGSTPRADAVAVSFPTFEFVPVSDALSFYTDLVQKRYLHACASEALIRAADILRAGLEPSKAIEALRDAVLKADDASAEQYTTDWTQDSEARLEAYERRRQNNGIDGIPSSFPTLDAETQGWHAGELIYFVARTKTGKSWLLAKLAHVALQHGSRPLIISKEMPESLFAQRLDAINSKLPYGKFRAGNLDEHQFNRWKLDLEALRESGNLPIVYLPKGGVTSVRAKLRRYKGTNVLFIDGAYLLEDERREKQDWLRLSNITKDLADLAKQEKIPVVVTLQLTDEETIARSKAMLQDASVVVKITRTEDDKLTNTATLEITHHREGNNCEVQLLWDLDRATIEEQQQAAAPAILTPQAAKAKMLPLDNEILGF